MGGTTAKCALVENGRFSVDSVYYAGGYVKGFPIKSSVIDIVEVGSGGEESRITGDDEPCGICIRELGHSVGQCANARDAQAIGLVVRDQAENRDAFVPSN